MIATYLHALMLRISVDFSEDDTSVRESKESDENIDEGILAFLKEQLRTKEEAYNTKMIALAKKACSSLSGALADGKVIFFPTHVETNINGRSVKLENSGKMESNLMELDQVSRMEP